MTNDEGINQTTDFFKIGLLIDHTLFWIFSAFFDYNVGQALLKK